ncbi:hypothetical protein RhiirA4_508408 [Rhizophagus irregularis]|uniref:Uncharacterized protein n=1 Tax=Rhizophagus irregularis TaxID=588596 RepID=A0A2I1HDH6_9GLOM|nr:hypothetical protein RhiirA4_508408 [Rhizophagus irregularis]
MLKSMRAFGHTEAFQASQLIKRSNSSVIILRYDSGAGLISSEREMSGEQVKKCSRVSINIPQLGQRESPAYKSGYRNRKWKNVEVQIEINQIFRRAFAYQKSCARKKLDQREEEPRINPSSEACGEVGPLDHEKTPEARMRDSSICTQPQGTFSEEVG